MLQLNLRFDNPTPEKVLSLIGRLNPDVVTLNEVSTRWMEKLAFIKAAYPHQIICSASYAIGGVAILSRRPFVAGTEPECSDRGSFAIADVDFAGRLRSRRCISTGLGRAGRRRMCGRTGAAGSVAGDRDPGRRLQRRALERDGPARRGGGGLTATPPVGSTAASKAAVLADCARAAARPDLRQGRNRGTRRGAAGRRRLGPPAVAAGILAEAPPVPADPVQTAAVSD